MQPDNSKGDIGAAKPMSPGGETAESSTRIYLARHGRTHLNAEGLLRGHLDPPLDSIGQEQARQLAAVLGHSGIERAVTSPLQRARETAQPLADLRAIRVESDERLIDRDYGRWAGHSADDLRLTWGSVDDAPDVERAGAVQKRAWDALVSIAEESPGRCVLIVSHEVVNRLLLIRLSPIFGDPDLIPQDTGCFNLLESDANGWRVLDINQSPKHLLEGDSVDKSFVPSPSGGSGDG